MDNDRFLALVEKEGERLAEAARSALDAEVPPCPGWTVRDVVVHTAEVYHHKIVCMRLGRRPKQGEWTQEPPPGRNPVDWFHDTLLALLAELRSRGPDAPSYTWWPADQTVGFWYRRMAQETVIHRVDVETAVDQIGPIDHELAIDGIDEVLERFLLHYWNTATPEQWRGASPQSQAEKSVAVRVGPHLWRVTLQPARITLAREPGPADATVTGEPAELLLWLWGRRPLSAVTYEGEPDVLQVFRDRLAIATQ